MALNRRIRILLIFSLGIMITFWSVSRYPALSNKAALSGTAGFDDPMTHQAHFPIPDRGPLHIKVFYTTLNWYETNWKGMTFGIVLAAAFMTLLTYLPRRASDNRFKNSFKGMFVGTPLGVCTNCVAPIAKSLYDAGSKMETALAVMFSSPTLNIIVLTMVFSIFPFYMAALKVAGTLVLILLIVPFISRNQPHVSRISPASNTAEGGTCELGPGSELWPGALLGVCRDYWTSLKYIVVRTVPLMLLAGFLGALLSHLWSFDLLIGMPVTFASLSLISFMGTFLPLPIAFDIMLAQALMMSGMPDGFVMTSLFTLGTFSIYSAMIVSRTFSLKLAAKLFGIVFLLGVALGWIADSISNYRHVQWLVQYDRIVGEDEGVEPTVTIMPDAIPSPAWHPTRVRSKESFLEQGAVSITVAPHAVRNSTGDKPFSKINGPDLGITYRNAITPQIFFDPLFFGRGIASGDLNNDGWTDIAVATSNGFELYQNINGEKFEKLDAPEDFLAGLQTINIALVDMNNDGRLDVFFTAFDGGNHLWLNPGNFGLQGKMLRVPNNNALITHALGFGDVNGDGYPDIVNGNYFLGVLTRTPIDTAVNQLVINRSLKFEISSLPGIPGQTHSVLLSDINDDAFLDLIVANDYLVADTYYIGTGDGSFRKILKQDGIVPVTTENSMSIDTADFNNDLVPDIYLANIGMSKGIDVISNIFGDAMREEGRTFCESGTSTLDRGECHEMMKLVTLLNPEKQDTSEHCTLLKGPQAVRYCMVTRMALLAAKRNDPSLCKKISKGHGLGRNFCNTYFKKRKLEFVTDEEIPMRSLSNILLQGSPDHRFKDVSDQTGVTTAEWSWNARFADLDNDEWQDLYVVNGVLITQEFATNNFFHNKQGNTFASAEEEFGLYDEDHSSAYTYLDFDNDGDLDIIGNTLYGTFKVFINNESKRNSVTFHLRDEKGNAFCIGCRVRVHYGPDGNRHQMREVKTSGGFHSFDAPVLHFGLDRFDSIKKVEVRWSTGETTVLDHPFPANRDYTIHRKNHGATGEQG